MFSAASVCQLIVSVCQQDDFRTIKRVMKLAETWHIGPLYKNLAEFEFGVKGQGHQYKKTKTC